MDLIKNFKRLNLQNYGNDIYSSISFDGVKNIHQKKILPIDIDDENINILKRVVTVIYTNSFDKIDIYKSRRGYTILCYSHTLPTKNQYEILFELEKDGVDISSVIASSLYKKFDEPFTEDFFITRTGFKFRNLKEILINNKNFSSMFEDGLKKDIYIITDFLHYFQNINNDVNKITGYIERVEKKMSFFKDFFYFYKKLDLINAFEPIYEIFLKNSHIANKKYLGTIQKDDNVIPDNVQNIYDIYNKKTNALKTDIKYLI